jgi:hypothetical protein
MTFRPAMARAAIAHLISGAAAIGKDNTPAPASIRRFRPQRCGLAAI